MDAVSTTMTLRREHISAVAAESANIYNEKPAPDETHPVLLTGYVSAGGPHQY